VKDTNMRDDDNIFSRLHMSR